MPHCGQPLALHDFGAENGMTHSEQEVFANARSGHSELD